VDTRFRELLRHGGVFGLGAILSRLASILLLPLYTHYLSPADYGIIALVDLTTGLLGLAGSAGIANAATREHFRQTSSRELDGVWWTALFMAAGSITFVVVTAFIFIEPLARVSFGSEVPQAAEYLSLALPTLWLATITYVLDSYFRAEKASTFLVSVNIARLIVNILLNVTLLALFHKGVSAVLIGNLITAALVLLVQGWTFVRFRPNVVWNPLLVRPYWRFGWPLILYGFLSAVMHEADRFVLRLFMDLKEVGIYSLAYQVGQGVNTLVLIPFASIWSVTLYEIAREPDFETMYARVFKHFVAGLSLVMLLASMLAGPILRLIAPSDYSSAADIVPVVCLAYLFFSLHEHFKVPALLASRTVSMVGVVAVAAVSNVGLNLWLVPRFGAAGAAWTSVLTFVVFSGGGLLQYRRLARYDYPFGRCAATVCGMSVTYIAYRRLLPAESGLAVQMGVALLLWIGWAIGLFGTLILQFVPVAVTSRVGERLRVSLKMRW
jgi:O-antigen/teichoic acid export membrane protein